MARNLKHSKIKNTGILFELLTRQITADVLAGKTSKSVQLVKKFFNENTELGKELELYRILSEKHYHSENRADYLLEAVIKSRRKLSNSSLRREKYNLIKQIKENYGVNAFFNSRISNYKVLASVYTLFENESVKEVVDSVEETDSKITILETITQSDIKSNKSSNKVLESYQTQDTDVRLLTYQLLVDKFNKKYSNLNESQKNLLREYINNLSNTNSLREFIDSEVTKVKSILKSHLKQVDDKITKIKLSEAIKHTDESVGGKLVKDSHVVALMRYYELIKELDHVHKDN